MLVRAADRILPGGDTVSALAVNAVLGVAFILAIGLLARALKGDRVAGRTMVLAALFPGSFVLSFAYSEPADAGARRAVPPRCCSATAG